MIKTNKHNAGKGGERASKEIGRRGRRERERERGGC